MAEIVRIKTFTAAGLLRLNDVEKIVGSLRRGGLVVLPTETGYLLGALATDVRAVASAFDAKRRDRGKPMHIACSSFAMVEKFAVVDLRAGRLLGELTPGPITVVLKKKPMLPDILVTLNGTVGIRIPDCPLTLQVIDALGAPITATSLNESGATALSLDDHGLEHLDWPEDEVIHVVEDESSVRYSKPSTLVRLAARRLEILREGPISESVIREVSEDMGYLEFADWT